MRTKTRVTDSKHLQIQKIMLDSLCGKQKHENENSTHLDSIELLECAQLLAVAHNRACAVRFNIGHLARLDAGLRAHLQNMQAVFLFEFESVSFLISKVFPRTCYIDEWGLEVNCGQKRQHANSTCAWFILR